MSSFDISISLIADMTESGIDPRCTGMWAACAIICPCRLNIAQEKSRLSLMFVDKADRHSATPISSAIEFRIFL